MTRIGDDDRSNLRARPRRLVVESSGPHTGGTRPPRRSGGTACVRPRRRTDAQCRGDRRVARRRLFRCALLPESGKSVTDRHMTEADVFVPGFAGNTVTRSDGASIWHGPLSATRCFYQDCSEGDAASAVARLRPQAAAPRTALWPGDAIRDVERTSILCLASGACRRTARVASRMSSWASRQRSSMEGIPRSCHVAPSSPTCFHVPPDDLVAQSHKPPLAAKPRPNGPAGRRA